MSRFARFVITYDLDHDSSISKTLQNLELKKGVHFFAIGIDKPGKRDIEGLLPDSIRSSVYAKNPDLMAVIASGEKERDQARSKLKNLLLEEFKSHAQPTAEYYGEFYKLSKALNKGLK